MNSPAELLQPNGSTHVHRTILTVLERWRPLAVAIDASLGVWALPVAPEKSQLENLTEGVCRLACFQGSRHLLLMNMVPPASAFCRFTAIVVTLKLLPFRFFSYLIFISGAASAVIGEFDEVADASKDLSRVRADPLKPVTH